MEPAGGAMCKAGILLSLHCIFPKWLPSPNFYFLPFPGASDFECTFHTVSLAPVILFNGHNEFSSLSPLLAPGLEIFADFRVALSQDS